MLACKSTILDNIAAHYDELDTFYRDLWGEHLHHGLWIDGREDASTAVRQLVEMIAAKARAVDAKVCDVGCGYGATARMLATEYQATVTGLTISQKQYEFALQQRNNPENPVFKLQDWLTNDLADESFDSVIAIESLSHMKSKPDFFRQAFRVLPVGGRIVLCAWLSSDNPRPWHKRWILEPICREGRLTGLGSASEYLALLEKTGFALEEFKDLSVQVRKTWSVSILNCVRGFLKNFSYWRFMFDRKQNNRLFLLTIFRIWLGYRLGCLQYGLFVGHKR